MKTINSLEHAEEAYVISNGKKKSEKEAIFEMQTKKEKRKRKEKEKHADEERSETSSELGEPVNFVKVKSKKPKVPDVVEEGGVVEGDHNAVSRFRISDILRAKLKENGIESLFPIQARTFDDILDGSDLVGRARTGQGKTLAFVLPMLESLKNGPAKEPSRTRIDKHPYALILLPTRELANQVHRDFNLYGGVMGLSSCCIYGGASYSTQEIKLKRGVDIVIGTPGRIKDHIERGNLDLSLLKFRVLDEADEMLRMGFVDDVELILGKVKDVTKVQTLLFSATLPNWVKNIASRFLKVNKKTIDLVENEKMKASLTVKHFVLPCSTSAMPDVIPDLIRCYSSGGRTIIFTEKRESANELASLLPGSMPLHGEIQQSQRESTLSGFRSGKFQTLVATNVAARGLDINNVQLIIQCGSPRDVEDYIHRSGRTGRAGNTGVAIMLYDPRRSNISRIERESGIKFEQLKPPKLADIVKAVFSESIMQVSDSVIPEMKPAVEDLLQKSGLPAVELLSKTLAHFVGHTETKTRSILTSMENHVTLLLTSSRPIYTLSVAYTILRRFIPEEKVEGVGGMTLTADGHGAVFDVDASDLDLFLEGQEGCNNAELEILETLPALQERTQSGGRFGGGGRFGVGARGSGRGRGRGAGGGAFHSRDGGFGGDGGRTGRGGRFAEQRNHRFSTSVSASGNARNFGNRW